MVPVTRKLGLRDWISNRNSKETDFCKWKQGKLKLFISPLKWKFRGSGLGQGWIQLPNILNNIFLFFFFRIIYLLLIHERHRERGRDTGRDTGRGRSRLHAGSPMQDLIPGLQDHTLG